MNKINALTSCASNYIHKARVMGKSLKNYHPEINLHLVISDKLPQNFDLEKEPFDSVITIEELGINNLNSWIFKHTIPEMCAAVKAISFAKILNEYECDKLFYIDPDMVIFSPMDDLITKLDDYSILLTPHQLEPEESIKAIIYNEHTFLKYGVFNLGFVAVKNSSQGKKFTRWWSDRCLEFCYDDVANGLYSDQRLIDLAPSFFSELHILRNSAYNVATWNLNQRLVSGDLRQGMLVDSLALCFYHFSTAQVIMEQEFKVFNETILSLWEWYKEECQLMDQDSISQSNCVYSVFDNGELITKEQRLLYRQRQDLQEKFINPFETQIPDNSYFYWYQHHEQQQIKQKVNLETNLEILTQEVKKLGQENVEIRQQLQHSELEVNELIKKLQNRDGIIHEMESSKFWKIRNLWFFFKGKLFGKTSN